MNCSIDNCDGRMICSGCHLEDCECEVYTLCDKCHHKKCNWCQSSTLKRSNCDDCCEECCQWDYYQDECEDDFCINYLNAQGIIMKNLKCNLCHSQPPLIRVPLAFPLSLNQILKEYPNFIKIQTQFLKYYAYSHTNGVWEPYPATEFRLAQEFFDFDGGVIVLGRSKDEETKAKNKELFKTEKEMRKKLKKERRMMRQEEKTDQILNI